MTPTPLVLLTALVLAAAPAAGSSAEPPAAMNRAPAPAMAGHEDAALRTAIDDPRRPTADRARDRYRHPYQTLAFWGLHPGMTVVDLEPGGGYWTEILAPYTAATGGVYLAGVADLGSEATSVQARAGRAAFELKHGDVARYGRIRFVDFGPKSGPFAPAGSVDLVITSREIHNWLRRGFIDKAMADAFAALKTGGVLAVEEHRADPRPQAPDASDGYVAVATVVDAARRAGFRLDATSEVNANAADTKSYPFGVWTLPPTRQSSTAGQPPDLRFDHSRYDAIGESDRMTLRFRKPG